MSITPAVIGAAMALLAIIGVALFYLLTWAERKLVPRPEEHRVL